MPILRNDYTGRNMVFVVFLWVDTPQLFSVLSKPSISTASFAVVIINEIIDFIYSYCYVFSIPVTLSYIYDRLSDLARDTYCSFLIHGKLDQLYKVGYITFEQTE